MLRFFFNRYSPMVRLMELIGVAAIALIIWRMSGGSLTFAQKLLFYAILLEYAFLRFCTFWRWYPESTPGTYGIGLQFLKAIIPTGYILAVMMWLFVLTESSAVLVITLFLLSVIAHVNVILIYLHFKDGDKTPVNRFSMTH